MASFIGLEDDPSRHDWQLPAIIDARSRGSGSVLRSKPLYRPGSTASTLRAGKRAARPAIR